MPLRHHYLQPQRLPVHLGGFKHGIPKDADYVFDARFLPNPHWEPDLKHLTGLDAPVEVFLGSQPVVTKFIWQIQNLITTWLPHLERN